VLSLVVAVGSLCNNRRVCASLGENLEFPFLTSYALLDYLGRYAEKCQMDYVQYEGREVLPKTQG